MRGKYQKTKLEMLEKLGHKGLVKKELELDPREAA